MRDAVSAYVRRDWLVWRSYGFNAAMHLAGVAVLVALVVTLGDALGASGIEVAGQRQNYVAFVLAGLAFADSLFAGLTSPPKAVREGQVSGTLEPVLLSPVRPVWLVIGASSFAFVQAALRSVLVVALAILVLGHWHDADFVALAAVAVPAWLGFLGLGLLASAFTIVVKQGDPVIVVYAGLSAIIGGAVVPVESLPGWLQGVGGLLPLTHALDGVRSALEGEPLSGVQSAVIVLVALAAVAVPVGIVALGAAFRYARREGSLVHY